MLSNATCFAVHGCHSSSVTHSHLCSASDAVAEFDIGRGRKPSAFVASAILPYVLALYASSFGFTHTVSIDYSQKAEDDCLRRVAKTKLDIITEGRFLLFKSYDPVSKKRHYHGFCRPADYDQLYASDQWALKDGGILWHFRDGANRKNRYKTNIHIAPIDPERGGCFGFVNYILSHKNQLEKITTHSLKKILVSKSPRTRLRVLSSLSYITSTFFTYRPLCFSRTLGSRGGVTSCRSKTCEGDGAERLRSGLGEREVQKFFVCFSCKLSGFQEAVMLGRWLSVSQSLKAAKARQPKLTGFRVTKEQKHKHQRRLSGSGYNYHVGYI